MKIETIENETKSENTPKCYGCGVVVFPEDDNFELNFIKIYRLWYLEKYFSDVENIYEFGCGTGWLTNSIRLYYKKSVKSIDFTEKALATANILI